MNKIMLQTYYRLIKGLSQLLTVARLYKFEHPMFKERLNQVFIEISKLLSEKQSLNFFESGGILLVSGKEIEIKDRTIKRFMESFHDLHLGSLDLESGLTLEEFEVFIRLLYQGKTIQGEDQIKQYLKEKGTEHIIPRYATYKMVEKDERIVKKGGILKVEELPSGVLDRFSQDLKNGKVSKRLIEKEESYRLLSHDPVFLSEAVFDLAKDKEDTQELSRILWLIGDYLIDEISTSKEEEFNRRVLDEFKNRLLSLWEQKAKKVHLKEEIKKTCVAISTALQLEGLILLYQRHKKDLDKVARKIQEILEILPSESRLYQKTRQRLEKIGAHFLNS